MSVIRLVGYLGAGILLGASNFGDGLILDVRVAALIVGVIVLVGTTLIDASTNKESHIGY